MPFFSLNSLTEIRLHDKLLSVRGRGVAANMRPCQGRDRGFEPRRSRLNQKNPSQKRRIFLCIPQRRYIYNQNFINFAGK